MLSTHVLDIAHGTPAEGVSVVLYRILSDSRQEIARAATNGEGRIASPFGGELEPGTYELVFAAGVYLQNAGSESFYENIPIRFSLADGRDYHVPLLLAPWGYSTYRGS